MQNANGMISICKKKKKERECNEFDKASLFTTMIFLKHQAKTNVLLSFFGCSHLFRFALTCSVKANVI